MSSFAMFQNRSRVGGAAPAEEEEPKTTTTQLRPSLRQFGSTGGSTSSPTSNLGSFAQYAQTAPAGGTTTSLGSTSPTSATGQALVNAASGGGGSAGAVSSGPVEFGNTLTQVGEDPAQAADQLAQGAGAPTMESVNQTLNDLIAQQMSNIDEQYKLRSDAITQGGLSQMRKAANLGAQMGQSFGGSFADAQRQAMMSTQGLQNQAFSEMLGAKNQVLGQQTALTFQEREAQRSRDFQQQMFDQQRQDRLDAAAGEAGVAIMDEIQDYVNDTGENPFLDPYGRPKPIEELPSELQADIRALADAGGMSVQEAYDSLNPRTMTPRQSDAKDLELENRLGEQSNDFDDLQAIVSKGKETDWDEYATEIFAVLNDGVSREDLIAWGIPAADIDWALSEKGNVKIS